MVTVPILGAETAARRETFFRIVFNKVSGYTCVARRVAGKGAFEERFFKWPDELAGLSQFVEESVMTHDLWFCPMTFDSHARQKARVQSCPAVWADLDTCPLDHLMVKPSIGIESSTGRYQALWLLEQPADPIDAEEASKKVAYFHADEGADKSGWDLTQLLRVPNTLNFKYNPPNTVVILGAGDNVNLEDFNVYPAVQEDAGAKWPLPDEIEDAQTLLDRHKQLVDPSVWRLFQLEPERDWSGALWNLEMLLAESQLEREVIFGIVREAKCNKYRRDHRSERMLWREVCKAWAKVAERSEIIKDVTVYKRPELMSDTDLQAARQDRTFVEDYIDWAKSVGDAAEAYHQAGAFVTLSALLAGAIHLPTSFGTIVPNMWFMLLADTTLTRKTTALDLAIDLLIEVEPDAIMATDGSIEGLFGSLSLRPGKPSVFLRDEFSGLLEMMTRRDYYAGMGETLTKLYDGKYQKRVLRREVIEVRDPVLIVLAGGIRTKVLQLLQVEHVSSGFVPRFVFITAQSNLARLRPLGPPSQQTLAGRNILLHRLQKMREAYHKQVEIKVGSTVSLPTHKVFNVELTPGAWELYNAMEMKMLESGLQSISQDLLTPTMDRLAKSGLKAAMLIAASRLKERPIVDEADIYKGFSYVADWREHAIEVIGNIGLSHQEHLTELIYQAIRKNPGLLRSTLMQNYHLTKRDADQILDTLDQRGLINRTRAGKSERLVAV